MIIDHSIGAINQIPTVYTPNIWSWSGTEGPDEGEVRWPDTKTIESVGPSSAIITKLT